MEAIEGWRVNGAEETLSATPSPPGTANSKFVSVGERLLKIIC
jgi:hypothetical protein